MTDQGSLNHLFSSIAPRLIEDEMKQSYLDYAMSVIVSRALPDVRDGLKPVHRRILYSMHENGYNSNKAYKKSSRIVGDVMGKYHPHGDAAIYEAMVRMAQDFSLRVPLVDGQGNFGSMDGDSAAAMRYTEARLDKTAEALLFDLEKDTVDFRSNYDDTLEEPEVLPARYPNLLVNGAGGIAVGMATNIPTHNIGEVIDACLAYIENNAITCDELMEHIQGPDFPTGGHILGKNGIISAYKTGKGSIVIRSKTHMEEVTKQKEAIVVTEIPYQVNKARMIEKIADLVRDKVITGISDLRDESDREGVRVVIELKKDAVSDVVLAQLFKHTQMQTSFGINMIALHRGRPCLMTLPEIIKAFVSFRDTVVIRRTRYDLRKARARAHILSGLLVAVHNLDPVIELIRAAKTPADAREALMSREWEAGDVMEFIRLVEEGGDTPSHTTYRLSEEQARAILELQLQRLTGMEHQKLVDESKDLQERIAYYLRLLASEEERMSVIREELLAVRNQFATPRQTDIIAAEFEQDLEALIEREDMVITVTHGGYIKRVPLSSYRAQRRGGKGRSGMDTKDDDFVVKLFVANTHAFVLFFSSKGMVYRLKVHQLPQGQPQSRGRALVNLLPLDADETITAVLPLPEDQQDGLYLVFATSSGYVRRNALSDFENIRANGKIAMKLGEGDVLVKVNICTEDQDVLLVSSKNMIIRFPVTDLRVFSGRQSIGVRGIKLNDNDRVISMSVLDHGHFTVEERNDYLRAISADSRLKTYDYSNSPEDKERDLERQKWLERPELQEMREREEFILSINNYGLGQLCSAYEYRISGRGGKGVNNMDMKRFPDGEIVSSFCVDRETGELMLVTDAGQVIRIHVKDIRMVSRNSKGVILFNLDKDQRVVSVASFTDSKELEEEEGKEQETPQTTNKLL